MLTRVDKVARGADRREDARKRLMLRVAKLRCLGGEYPCVVHDVSETGVKLRLFHAHPADSHMYLELASGALYAIERRWMDGAFAGYRFSSRIEVEAFVAESNPEGGRPIRLRISHPVHVAFAGELNPAMLVDLSCEGACFETWREVPRLAPTHLELRENAPRLAYVQWRKDARHGVVFQEALTLESLARLALELQPIDAAEVAPAGLAVPAQALSA